MNDHPLASFLCGRDDITPGGCTDTQPCICLAIQASIAVDTAARDVIRVWDRMHGPATVPPIGHEQIERLRDALGGVDRVNLLREMV